MTPDTTPATGDTTPDTATRHLALGAGAATLALTAVAFWLSYEHLAGVARHDGLGDDSARSWAWPATVDLFIVIGELLILRSALQRRVDLWAIALTVLGSGGSIALNIAGVGGGAARMEYVVAAVPPVAALFAFGALMRQIHAALASPALAAAGDVADSAPAMSGDTNPVTPSVEAATANPAPPLPPVTPDMTPDTPPEESDATPDEDDDAPDTTPVTYDSPVDRAIRPLYNSGHRPTTGQMTAAMTAVGLEPKPSTARASRMRIERREPHLKSLPSSLEIAS